MRNRREVYPDGGETALLQSGFWFHCKASVLQDNVALLIPQFLSLLYGFANSCETYIITPLHAHGLCACKANAPGSGLVG